jgi:hypothetical protein
MYDDLHNSQACFTGFPFQAGIHGDQPFGVGRGQFVV